MTTSTATNNVIVRVSSGETNHEPLPDTDIEVYHVGSTGFESVEPLVMITSTGRTAFYSACSTERIQRLVDALEDGTNPPVGSPDDVVDHEATTSNLPVPDGPGFGAGERAILGGCGWRRPTNPADHRAAGGFEPVDKNTVLAIGTDLMGRGWGDWCHDEPVIDTWDTVKVTDDESTLVINAHAHFADTLLLSSTPFEVLDGARALARTVGCSRIVVYTGPDSERTTSIVEEAVAEYPDLDIPVSFVTGPESYRASEPTMALEAIEGNHRLEARVRPPGPEEFGLHGQPTLIHTPRTLAHLSVALREGELPRTRSFTVTGDVSTPVTVELPETATLERVVEAATPEGELKAVCVGDRFGGLTDELDVSLATESLRTANLGTAGTVTVLTTDQCLLEFVGKRASFAAEENCGRCVPCREGTSQLADLLRGIYDGNFERDAIQELVQVMSSSSLCLYGQHAGRPVQTAIDEFHEEFEAHANGQCPAGSCPDTEEVPQ